jgi:hypothetical protein
MNALVFFGWWFGLSLIAGVGVGRLLGRAALATVTARSLESAQPVIGSRAVR